MRFAKVKCTFETFANENKQNDFLSIHLIGTYSTSARILAVRLLLFALVSRQQLHHIFSFRTTIFVFIQQQQQQQQKKTWNAFILCIVWLTFELLFRTISSNF